MGWWYAVDHVGLYLLTTSVRTIAAFVNSGDGSRRERRFNSTANVHVVEHIIRVIRRILKRGGRPCQCTLLQKLVRTSLTRARLPRRPQNPITLVVQEQNVISARGHRKSLAAGVTADFQSARNQCARSCQCCVECDAKVQPFIIVIFGLIVPAAEWGEPGRHSCR